MNMLKTGMEWLRGQREAHMGTEVKYHVGAQSAEATATRGRKTYEVVTAAGMIETIESMDWLITASLLVIDGRQIARPERGHRIKETLADGTTRLYEVLDLGGRSGCYSVVGEGTWRIHSKFVGLEDPE